MRFSHFVVVAIAAACAACGGGASGEASDGLLVALARFEVSDEGKVLPQPGPAHLEIWRPGKDGWRREIVEDSASNVFHKALQFDGGILTLGGSAAALKLWKRTDGELEPTTIWERDFGGKFSRMRDAEPFDHPAGGEALAVATHDQGVVAVLRRDGQGGWTVDEIDAKPKTFVHEIEIGDLDGDGAVEVYATPSEPNRLDGRLQRGEVVRYRFEAGAWSREVAADLGTRHAKEILVADVDGDGRDELYVSVEAVEGGRLEIRRFDAETPADGGEAIATLQDKLCRFLTAGDVDGDGRREIVAAANKSGLWLLRPPREGGAWTKTSIDRDSTGFEHAALLADLDRDGRDELYVAADDQDELRRYVMRDGKFERELIHRRAVHGAVFTWNLAPLRVGG